jgi:GMP reductase
MEIFDYDNILLLPRKCRVESRSECDAGIDFGGRRFKLPVVPANMKTVVDEKICIWLAERLLLRHAPLRLGQRGLRARHEGARAVRLDLGGRQAGRLRRRWTAWRPRGWCPEYITIDIAHGHADSVREMIAT